MSFYLHLPILIVVVSLVYSATRHDDWNKILREALSWGIRMFTFLLVIGVVLFAISTLPTALIVVLAIVIVIGVVLFAISTH